MPTSVVIVAAGAGSRAGGPLPKQFQMLAGQPVLARTITAFKASALIDQIVVVIDPTRRADFDEIVAPYLAAPVTVVDGGSSRSASVKLGLDAVVGEKVLIHDGARPLVSDAVIGDVVGAIAIGVGAAPALAITEALWRASGENVDSVIDREAVFRAQTPQGFMTNDIRRAHGEFSAEAADDVEVARAAGLAVRIIAGEEGNAKITRAEDFEKAGRLLNNFPDIRTGTGFDVHAFCDGETMTLCGVTVPHDKGLLGHSDADVAMHAVTDAIYGALALGDIGQHFPPSDPKWKGAASDIFLKHAVAKSEEMGFGITNLDCTIICEQPKIGPHAIAMRTSLAKITGLAVERISVKATTSEGLGFTGRGEGIAAQAVATLVRK
jgi:2-C-methyl-D-erythritol 4-phosphate cytidylyltransferase/2-C-methyl-D-erythritol 2,4-cyclodiphosphate synthase